MIPRVIHQIYLSGGELPSPLRENVDHLKAMNPGWEHRLWDDRQAVSFLRAFYGDGAAELYSRIDRRYGASRADFLRHVIIYALGGVYFDIKCGATKPLDEIIQPDDEYLLTQWPEGHPCAYPHRELSHVPGGEFVTFFIAGVSGNRFSAAVIQRMMRNIVRYKPWHSVGRNGALRLGGPIAATLAIAPHLAEHRHRFVPFDFYLTDGPASPVHYSELKIPVVELGPIGNIINRLVVNMHSATE